MKPSRELFLEQTLSRRLGVDVKKGARRPRGRRAPPTPVGPSQLHRPTSSSYIYPYTPKTSRSTTKPYFHRRNLLYPRDPILGPFRSSAGGGIDHGGPLHHVILPNALLRSYELNTLDACWIVVDVWSNSSRCRIISVYLSRTWCLYTWSYLDILLTMRNSINCSTVIRLPTVILMLLREATSETYGPGPIFYHINLPILSYFLCHLFYFASLFLFIIKIPKILSYHIYQISLS